MSSICGIDLYARGNILTADDENLYVRKVEFTKSREEIIEAIQEKDNCEVALEFAKAIRKYCNPEIDYSIFGTIGFDFEVKNPDLKTLLLYSNPSSNFDLIFRDIEVLSNSVEGIKKIRERYQKYYKFLLLSPYFDLKTLGSESIEELQKAKELFECIQEGSNAGKLLCYKDRARGNGKVIELTRRTEQKFNRMKMN